jgi:hypothetical protein
MKKLLGLLGLCLCATLRAQDHGHLNVGAPGDLLNWNNGADYSGAYVKTLTFTNAGKYAGFYQGNITLTVMHSVNPFGEVDPAAPRAGALVEAEIVSVEGPEGGAFGFWENTSVAGTPTINIPTGTTNAGFRFILGEEALGAGSPGGDAFGHIHGRRFTASKPGTYTVGFRAHDISVNGPNGGPIHGASGILLVKFQAGVVLAPGNADGATGGHRVTIGAMSGFSWQLQSSDELPGTQWTDVGTPVFGEDLLVTIEDPRPLVSRRFYRAVGTAVAP